MKKIVKMRKNISQGFTLIELLVTITISSMVLVYATTAFTGIGNGFKLLGVQNDSVQKMIIRKKQIESCINSIGAIDSWTSTSLRYKKQGNDSLVTVQFRNGLLMADGRIVCSKLSNFKFSVIENMENKPELNNDQVLLWECLSDKNGMIFGAVVFRE